jgi:hypothetical protein
MGTEISVNMIGIYWRGGGRNNRILHVDGDLLFYSSLAVKPLQPNYGGSVKVLPVISRNTKLNLQSEHALIWWKWFK